MVKKRKNLSDAYKTKVKKVFKGVVKEGKTMKQAMIEAGYSPKTAKNPQNITSKPTWKELLDKNLPEQMLTEETEKLTMASSFSSSYFPANMTNDDIEAIVLSNPGWKLISVSRTKKRAIAFCSIPDMVAKAKGLDFIAKFRNKYAPIEIKNISRFESMSIEELDKEEERLNNLLRRIK